MEYIYNQYSIQQDELKENVVQAINLEIDPAWHRGWLEWGSLAYQPSCPSRTAQEASQAD